MHHQITVNVKQFVRIVDHPLACMLLVHFVMVVTELFYAYTSFIQDMRSGNDVQIEKYISSIILAAFEGFQFYFIISACAEITEQAEKMGLLINEFLQIDAGVAVDRCIETFTIELLHQDFKIDNCGLYNIDYTLMFSMIATMTSYLIMLVQFQLAEV
ncbi:putative gustatory receptor 28b [Anopheles ziemanni]|uniref:putative gustatory receptor 28b n=1 Tax=Anopheles coustani TaxID=139045 RepID=UPI002657FFFD|nr:putative gustatory receptor 28b [Anopheles coustani]XP_058174288.1 putative gustatory receptor 28b [Anopheles ziemanni]